MHDAADLAALGLSQSVQATASLRRLQKPLGLPMKLPRRQVLHLAAGAAALPAVSRIASAETYPTRPVRLIVFPPAPRLTV